MASSQAVKRLNPHAESRRQQLHALEPSMQQFPCNKVRQMRGSGWYTKLRFEFQFEYGFKLEFQVELLIRWESVVLWSIMWGFAGIDGTPTPAIFSLFAMYIWVISAVNIP